MARRPDPAATGSIPALQRRSRESHDRLIQAGLDLLAEAGPDAVTVAAVAARAELAVGTVYRRFGSKEQLLASLQGAFIEGFLADRDALAPDTSEPDARERIRSAVHALSKAFEDHAALMGRLMVLGLTNTGVRAKGEIASQEGRHRFASWLDGIDIAHADREAALDVAYRMVYAACAHRLIHGESLESDRPFPWDELHEQLGQMIASYLLEGAR